MCHLCQNVIRVEIVLGRTDVVGCRRQYRGREGSRLGSGGG